MTGCSWLTWSDDVPTWQITVSFVCGTIRTYTQQELIMDGNGLSSAEEIHWRRDHQGLWRDDQVRQAVEELLTIANSGG